MSLSSVSSSQMVSASHPWLHTAQGSDFPQTGELDLMLSARLSRSPLPKQPFHEAPVDSGWLMRVEKISPGVLSPLLLADPSTGAG